MVLKKHYIRSFSQLPGTLLSKPEFPEWWVHHSTVKPI